MNYEYDTVIVGSGPNGLAAGIVLAQKGRSVLILEANDTLGGGCRTLPLTLPQFQHDLCSAVHPMGACSPFFRTLPLHKFGLNWVYSPAELAHPLDDGSAILLRNSLGATLEELNPSDKKSYRQIFQPLISRWEDLLEDTLGPLIHIPKNPFLLANFGRQAIQSAEGFAKRNFSGERAKALFAGICAHSGQPLDTPASSAMGLILSVAAHAMRWPIVQGGSQKLAEALQGLFESLGGKIQFESRIRSPRDIPPSKVVLFDLTPAQILKIFKEELPSKLIRKWENYRYGPAVFKMDFALSEPIPWRASECLQSATVHLGGRLQEIAFSEKTISNSQVPNRPFLILSQPTLFDSTRAPLGKHIAWAYCHTPLFSQIDVSPLIENQIERFAPGFKQTILAKSSLSPAQLELQNENHWGGDISGGSSNLSQLFFRPFRQLNPYKLPIKNYYLCSSSTPPWSWSSWNVWLLCCLSRLKRLSLSSCCEFLSNRLLQFNS